MQPESHKDCINHKENIVVDKSDSSISKIASDMSSLAPKNDLVASLPNNLLNVQKSSQPLAAGYSTH